MYSIDINGTEYPLKFGLGFMRDMNKKYDREDEDTGRDEGNGLVFAIAKVKDGDIDTLLDVIMTANKTESEKIPKTELEEWFENDDTDIDKVFEDIDGFFAKANCTKKAYEKVMTLLSIQERIQENEY